MEMVLKFKNTIIENIDLSNISIEPGTLLRINFSDLDTYEKYFYNKRTFSFNKEVIHLGYWGKEISRKNFLCTYATNELLIKYLDYSHKDINKFEELMYPGYKEKKLGSPLSERIKSLPYGDRMLIYSKLYIEKNKKPIILGTAGMHVPNLRLYYTLLNSFLKKGGICIELNYPAMGKKEFLDILDAESKVITINT